MTCRVVSEWPSPRGWAIQLVTWEMQPPGHFTACSECGGALSDGHTPTDMPGEPWPPRAAEQRRKAACKAPHQVELTGPVGGSWTAGRQDGGAGEGGGVPRGLNC